MCRLAAAVGMESKYSATTTGVLPAANAGAPAAAIGAGAGARERAISHTKTSKLLLLLLEEVEEDDLNYGPDGVAVYTLHTITNQEGIESWKTM